MSAHFVGPYGSVTFTTYQWGKDEKTDIVCLCLRNLARKTILEMYVPRYAAAELARLALECQGKGCYVDNPD